MKRYRYHLRILLPSSNTTYPDQSFETVIESDRMTYGQAGNYEFYSDKGSHAYYPIRYTIIEKIEEVK